MKYFYFAVSIIAASTFGCKSMEKNNFGAALQSESFQAVQGEEFQSITQPEFDALRGEKKSLLGCLCIKDANSTWTPWKFHMLGSKGVRIAMNSASAFDACVSARESNEACKGAQ